MRDSCPYHLTLVIAFNGNYSHGRKQGERGGGYGGAPPGKSRKKRFHFSLQTNSCMCKQNGFPSNVCLKIKNKHFKIKSLFFRHPVSSINTLVY